MSDVNWYDNIDINSERAILAEEIKIDEYRNFLGKFYIPVLTPDLNIKREVPTDEKKPAPKINIPAGSPNLTTKEYYKSNYIYLVIPRALVQHFTDIIPAKSEFIIEGLGSEMKINKLRITGIYEGEKL